MLLVSPTTVDAGVGQERVGDTDVSVSLSDATLSDMFLSVIGVGVILGVARNGTD